MEQINEKLNRFLTDEIRLDKETDVVYLLVEIRKFIDMKGTSDYPILKFYCDWAVHTRKDHITANFRKIVDELYEDIVIEINKGWPSNKRKVSSFMYMEQPKLDLLKFLNDNKLPTTITDTDNWIEFITTCTSILSDQPIVSPIDEIESINIIPASRGHMICRITFSSPVNGYEFYDYKNVI